MRKFRRASSMSVQGSRKGEKFFKRLSNRAQRIHDKRFILNEGFIPLPSKQAYDIPWSGIKDGRFFVSVDARNLYGMNSNDTWYIRYIKKFRLKKYHRGLVRLERKQKKKILKLLDKKK